MEYELHQHHYAREAEKGERDGDGAGGGPEQQYRDHVSAHLLVRTWVSFAGWLSAPTAGHYGVNSRINWQAVVDLFGR